jgi:hypothetical protein
MLTGNVVAGVPDGGTENNNAEQKEQASQES